MSSVLVSITFRNGGRVRVQASKEFAAALVMDPPAYIAGLTIAGGVDDFVRSHVPLGPPAWAERGREHAELN